MTQIELDASSLDVSAGWRHTGDIVNGHTALSFRSGDTVVALVGTGEELRSLGEEIQILLGLVEPVV